MQTVELLEIISNCSEKIIEICGVQWLIPKFSLYFCFIILVMQIIKRKDVKDKYSGISSLEAGLTLYIFLILILYIIELIIINNTIMNIDKIKLEVVLEFNSKRHQNFEILIRMKPDSILLDNIQIIFYSILLLIRYKCHWYILKIKSTFTNQRCI